MKKSPPPKPSPTPAASPLPLPRRVTLTKRFLALAKALPAAERTEIDAALKSLPETWGRPHAHRGASVRVLKTPAYELRAGLALRVIFFALGDELRCDFVGTHDEVRRYLRNRA